MDSLFSLLDLKYEIKEKEHGSFILGRCGNILIGEKEIGVIGEINPLVLSNFGIEVACSGLELDIDTLSGLIIG